MTNESEIGSFQKERENTDKSLDAERTKATNSLNTANAKSQVQTDEILKDERSIADQQTASSRADHDGNRAASANRDSDPNEMARLTEERRRTDMATGLERTRMDEVLLSERKTTSKLVAKVLEQERIATDHSLLVERNTTDDNREDSSNLLQSEIEKHQKTQGTLTSREEFLAIVSHDLRNPIGAIGAYAGLILEGDSDAQLGPESSKFIHAIKRNADIALRLISDLLDLERISQDKLTMNFSKCDASDIINTAVEIFQPLASEKNIALFAELPDTKLILDCDHDRILQAISNLIGNALKYTPKGGEVTVSAKAQQSSVEFIVMDNGPGIPKAKQPEIFKRFAQLSSNDRTGLGLGLHIAKTIIEMHSGELKVESEVGKGSKFHFTIRRA